MTWESGTLRRLHMGDARLLGQHTDREWAEVMARFAYRCVCCGKAGILLTKDHVIPITRGGSDDIGNIQPLCRPCNTSKGQDSIDYRDMRLLFSKVLTVVTVKEFKGDAQMLGRMGGKARAKKLTAQQRKEIARKAGKASALARWQK